VGTCPPLAPLPGRCTHEDGAPIHFRYLRLSVTDRCTLRCVYCMPAAGPSFLARGELLSLEEQARVVRVLAARGIEKVRITGGEPLLRRNLPWLIEAIAATPGVREVTLTTNGIRLAEEAGRLRAAGLRRVNVSLDSLDPATFARITRGGELARVLGGIDAALAAGLAPVKVNAVVLGGVNDDELDAFAELALSRPVEVRFIERMPVGALAEAGGFVPEAEVRFRLGSYRLVDLGRDGSPARRFRISDGRREGRVGFVSAMSRPFCEGCDRLRLTADGRLRACLFDGAGVDVRALLRGGAGDDALAAALDRAARLRPGGVHGPRIDGATMARIGG
jgi:cyclic pyranopterin phosphate synthase